MDGNGKISKKEKNSSYFRERHNYITILMCIAGVVVNLLLSRIAGLTGAPLYLDTVGSISVAAMGGCLPGVIVGFSTNILKSLSDSSALYYGVLNVLIALMAAFITKLKKLNKPLKFILAVLTFAVIGGGIGSLIPLFLDDVSFDSESLSTAMIGKLGISKELSYITSGIITDIGDKAISVILALIIIKLLPENIRNLFSFTGWMQTPLSNEESAAAKRSSHRVMSLRTKILLSLSVSLIAVSLAATGTSMMLYGNALIRDHTQFAEGAARIAAQAIDPERVDDFIENGADAEGYTATEQLLEQIRLSSTDIQYLYVYKIEHDGCHVVFDLDTEEMEGSPAGDIIPFDVSFEKYIPALLAGEPIEPIISNDSYGWLLTVYKPVYDSTGKCVCYAAADVSMDRIRFIKRNFFVEMLSVFLGFFILIFVLMRWLIEYHIIFPVNSIAMSTGTFAYDSEKARVNSIERIHELNIHTGDEVENLYHAITKTSDDSMRYVADVQRKTDELAQMQNALIMVLADIVESRDKNTGAHVRKTAAYTRIILNEMKKKGYYADHLTDEYISDVVSSAPLHDVGKIQVPDAILNKPGRLNDEEFSVMKGHALAGRDIINQAIALVPNSGYLSEARNLAAYHHEKWDGSGYPHGISGEDIPLSARVMAVADVFDALVSKRSYKNAFSYEEAMKIIIEGSGKHFDPLIVDAFVSAEDDVRKVEEEFSRLTDETGCFTAVNRKEQ